ncbi:hypothetical protein LCGC14_1210010, partial [marine sediment metagenome]
MKQLIAKLAKKYNCPVKFTKKDKLYKRSREEFEDKVDWHYVSCYQKLSEDFIREFKDKVDWPYVSCYQKLSEDFIREFKDKVAWYHVSSYQ